METNRYPLVPYRHATVSIPINLQTEAFQKIDPTNGSHYCLARPS